MGGNIRKKINKAFFLDRDGVINKPIVIDRKPFSPHSLEQLHILPKVQNAIKLLKNNNFYVIGITNQPDVKRGTVRKKFVDQINDFLKNELELDAIYTCFHDDDDNCICRKPKPGLILSAASKFSIDLEKSFFVGDRKKDIDAGLSANCKTIFIDYNYNEEKPLNADYYCRSLYDAVKLIIG